MNRRYSLSSNIWEVHFSSQITVHNRSSRDCYHGEESGDLWVRWNRPAQHFPVTRSLSLTHFPLSHPTISVFLLLSHTEFCILLSSSPLALSCVCVSPAVPCKPDEMAKEKAQQGKRKQPRWLMELANVTVYRCAGSFDSLTSVLWATTQVCRRC